MREVLSRLLLRLFLREWKSLARQKILSNNLPSHLCVIWIISVPCLNKISTCEDVHLILSFSIKAGLFNHNKLSIMGFWTSPWYLAHQFFFKLRSLKLLPWCLSGKESSCSCKETQKMWIWSLGWEDLLGEEMATHSNVLAWEIPRTEEAVNCSP